MISWLALGALALAGLGCGPDSRYPGSEPAPDEAAAIGRIAYTRLTHEQACRPSGDVDGRLRALRTATEAEIHPSACKSSVHPRQLDACVADIQRWPCDVALRTVTVIEACKTEPLCGVPAEDTL
ncbi:MAG TPA: DUF6184 family natural product biosynthesis lipoprotein [Labilithrix sp.]|nr:DUF6184 family natural product biosynthesis lipoprotein [Labilithrix sp.]